MKWSTYESVYRKCMVSSKSSPDKLIVNDVMNISDVCDVQQQVTYFALLPVEKEYYKFYLDVSHCGTTFQNTKTMVFIPDQVLPDKRKKFNIWGKQNVSIFRNQYLTQISKPSKKSHFKETCRFRLFHSMCLETTSSVRNSDVNIFRTRQVQTYTLAIWKDNSGVDLIKDLQHLFSDLRSGQKQATFLILEALRQIHKNFKKLVACKIQALNVY